MDGGPRLSRDLPYLRDPVTWIIDEMAVLTRKARTTGVPTYLNHHFTLRAATRHTRSAALYHC